MLDAQLKNKYQLSLRLGEALAQEQRTVCTVESCTGGGIAFAITDVPGSSAWFERAWVSYSNEAKSQLVGVEPTTLDEFGAVSQEVVTQMAFGARQRANADYSLAVSGIAGPCGGSPGKPVGLVWFAIDTALDTYTFSRCFSGDRQQVREQAIVLGLEKLISCVVNAQ
ncbi:CinA family protein [Glaciecola siphonariae]|uniref:CinA family protein n=1 Tax=Glaciecola siphonariae TaxID=521012 RepID=A0ABV9LXC5_9ALTE